MVLQVRLPLDTVAVNYRGQFINGTVFDQSYQGELDPETATPKTFVAGGVIAGWSTALMKDMEV